jgi:hypothetical protein
VHAKNRRRSIVYQRIVSENKQAENISIQVLRFAKIGILFSSQRNWRCLILEILSMAKPTTAKSTTTSKAKPAAKVAAKPAQKAKAPKK